MNGSIVEGTPIIVDFWKRIQHAEEKVFFLTHLHSDHIQGLTSSWRYPIYTSKENCLLLKDKFNLKEDILHGLELDTPHLIPTGSKDCPSITVVPIDANHVPGSVAFLFQGSFGNIFYCGDFRFHNNMVKNQMFAELSDMERTVDRLYLDNTFCSPRYDFPSRESATELVFNIIKDHPNHTVKLGIRNFGKEVLLESIAIRFQELILVGKEKFNQLKSLRRPNVYTTNFEDSRIHAININWINTSQQQKWNSYQPTISIRLTAIDYGVPVSERRFANSENGIYTVPYSDHSSWGEILSLVQLLRPRKVLPIVKHKMGKDQISIALRGRDDMSVFDDLLSTPPSTSLKNYSTNSSGNQSCFTENPFKAYVCSETSKKRRRALSKGVVFSSFEEDEKTTNVFEPFLETSQLNELGKPLTTVVNSPQRKGGISKRGESEKLNDSYVNSSGESEILNDSFIFNSNGESLILNYPCDLNSFTNSNSVKQKENQTIISSSSKELNEGYDGSKSRQIWQSEIQNRGISIDLGKSEESSNGDPSTAEEYIGSDTRSLIRMMTTESDNFLNRLRKEPNLDTRIVIQTTENLLRTLNVVNGLL